MINDIKNDVQICMGKSIDVFKYDLICLCIGCVSIVLVDNIKVFYYGLDMLLNQVVLVVLGDLCLIIIMLFEKSLVVVIEKVLMVLDIGIMLIIVGMVICFNMLLFIEECCCELVKYVGYEGENVKIVICNICCDVLQQVKDLFKEKQIIEDEECKVDDEIQKLIDCFVKDVDVVVKYKEDELLSI